MKKGRKTYWSDANVASSKPPVEKVIEDESRVGKCIAIILFHSSAPRSYLRKENVTRAALLDNLYRNRSKGPECEELSTGAMRDPVKWKWFGTRFEIRRRSLVPRIYML